MAYQVEQDPGFGDAKEKVWRNSAGNYLSYSGKRSAFKDLDGGHGGGNNTWTKRYYKGEYGPAGGHKKNAPNAVTSQSGEWNTGGGDAGWMDNAKWMPILGHGLAAKNGGRPVDENYFAQEAGQNNSVQWRTDFEGGMYDDIQNGNQDDYVAMRISFKD
ncbi:hypothetical protein ACU6U9_12470 [Pseudomonas sp. HK3]